MSMSSLEETRSFKTSPTTRSDVVSEQSNEERNGAKSCNQIPVKVDQSGIYYTIDRKAPKKP